MSEDDENRDVPVSRPPEAAAPSRPDIWDRQDYLEDLADYLGVENPPEVTLIREIHPDDGAAVMKTCMAEFGFEVTILSDGDWRAEYPADQADAFNEAWYICGARFPVLSVFYQPYDDATQERVYEYLVTEVAPCFADAGHPIDMPTLETFKAQYALDRSIAQPFLSAPTSLWDSCHINIPNDVIYPR